MAQPCAGGRTHGGVRGRARRPVRRARIRVERTAAGTLPGARRRRRARGGCTAQHRGALCRAARRLDAARHRLASGRRVARGRRRAGGHRPRRQRVRGRARVRLAVRGRRHARRRHGALHRSPHPVASTVGPDRAALQRRPPPAPGVGLRSRPPRRPPAPARGGCRSRARTAYAGAGPDCAGLRRDAGIVLALQRHAPRGQTGRGGAVHGRGWLHGRRGDRRPVCRGRRRNRRVALLQRGLQPVGAAPRGAARLLRGGAAAGQHPPAPPVGRPRSPAGAPRSAQQCVLGERPAGRTHRRLGDQVHAGSGARSARPRRAGRPGAVAGTDAALRGPGRRPARLRARPCGVLRPPPGGGRLGGGAGAAQRGARLRPARPRHERRGAVCRRRHARLHGLGAAGGRPDGDAVHRRLRAAVSGGAGVSAARGGRCLAPDRGRRRPQPGRRPSAGPGIRLALSARPDRQP